MPYFNDQLPPVGSFTIPTFSGVTCMLAIAKHKWPACICILVIAILNETSSCHLYVGHWYSEMNCCHLCHGHWCIGVLKYTGGTCIPVIAPPNECCPLLDWNCELSPECCLNWPCTGKHRSDHHAHLGYYKSEPDVDDIYFHDDWSWNHACDTNVAIHDMP